jgi:uncharacterized protein involved in outer membrane biogenesis
VNSSDFKRDAACELRTDPKIASRFDRYALPIRAASDDLRSFIAGFGKVQEKLVDIAEPISPLLLPTFEFRFDRLKAMDAAVDFRADSIQAQKVPIKNVAFTLKLEQGDLTIDPIDFALPEGQLAGNIELNTKNTTPQTSMDIHLTDIRLDQFKSNKATAAGPLYLPFVGLHDP